MLLVLLLSAFLFVCLFVCFVVRTDDRSKQVHFCFVFQIFVLPIQCCFHYSGTPIKRSATGLFYTFIHFTITGSLYWGLRYTGVFVIPGSSLYRGLRYNGVFVISGFHCSFGLFGSAADSFPVAIYESGGKGEEIGF